MADNEMSATEARWRDRLSGDDSSSGSSGSSSSSSSSSSSGDWTRPSNRNQGESVTPDDDLTRTEKRWRDRQTDTTSDTDETKPRGSDRSNIEEGQSPPSNRNQGESVTPDSGQGGDSDATSDTQPGYVVGGESLSEQEAEQVAEQQLVKQEEDITAGMIEADVTKSGSVTYTVTEAGAQNLFDQYGVTPGDQIGTGEIQTERDVAANYNLGAGDIAIQGGEVTPTSQRAQTEFALRGIEQSINDQYPDASRYSINPVEGADAYAVDVTTGAGNSLEFIVGQDAPQPSADETARTQYNNATVGRFGSDITGGRPSESESDRITTQRPTEQFGDYDLSIGSTTITDEEAQRKASREYNQAVERATGAGGMFGESLIAEGLEYAGYDQAAETLEQTGRNLLSGAGSILNPAAVAVTATETAEYGIYGAQQIAEGDFEDFASESKEAGVEQARAFGQYIQENPAEAIGMGAGALVGSAAIMGAAGRISSRAGAATRYAIQPGEEIAGSVGFRATRAIGGETSAQRLFPNREPVIFSEEAAIRGLKGARSRVSGLEYTPASTRMATSESAFEGPELGRSVTTEQAGGLVDEIDTTARQARKQLEYTPARERNPVVTRVEPTDELGLSLAAQQETTIGTELTNLGGRARDRVPGVEYRPASERFVSVSRPARAELGTSLAAQQPTTIGTELVGYGKRAQTRLPDFEYTAAQTRGVTGESDFSTVATEGTYYATEEGELFSERNPLGTPMEGERRMFEGLQERYQRVRYPQRGVEGYDRGKRRFDPTQPDDVDAIWLEGEYEGMESPLDPEIELERDDDTRVAQVATAETDVGSNRIQTRTETEMEQTGVARELSRREPSFDTETRLRTETAIFDDQQGIEQPSGGLEQPSGEMQGQPQADAIAQPEMQLPVEGVGLDIEAPTELETDSELELGFEQELAQETEAENEQELEFEAEAESETRREIFGLPDFESGNAGGTPGLFGADRGERITAFINPLTGERL